MNRQRRLWLALAALLLPRTGVGQPKPAASATHGEAPVELAVLVPPFLSPAALLETVRPLREHLQRQLGRPVAFYSAIDYRALYSAVARGEPVLVMLPAHVAAVAFADGHYTALAALQQESTLLMMVRADSPLQRLAELKGRHVGMIDSLSLTAVSTRQWLQSEHLQAGRDLHIAYQPTFNSGVVALEQGEIDALVMTSFQISVLRGEAIAKLRHLASGPSMPAPMVLARSDLPPALLGALRRALTDFSPDPKRPVGVFNDAMIPISPARLQALQALVEPTRALLKWGP